MPATTLTGVLSLMVATVCLSAQIAAPGGGNGGRGGGGGGGGGHAEPAGNNLSFPVIWADTPLSLPGTMSQATLTEAWPVLVSLDGVSYYAYAQKTEGNVWQAENTAASGPLAISVIDWGDSLESIDMKVGRPVRIELSFYKALDTPMLGFTMAMLANPSSQDEVQGAISPYGPPTTEAVTYPSYEATVYSQFGRLVVQSLVGLREDVEDDDLTWDGTQWVDADTADSISVGPPQSLKFTGELNVGGKVIYGLSEGGWKPQQIGDYRITFYFAPGGKASFDGATTIRQLAAEVIITAEGDTAGGTAVIDVANNLTYIDIRVAGGGGGGGGGKGR